MTTILPRIDGVLVTMTEATKPVIKTYMTASGTQRNIRCMTWQLLDTERNDHVIGYLRRDLNSTDSPVWIFAEKLKNLDSATGIIGKSKNQVIEDAVVDYAENTEGE